MIMHRTKANKFTLGSMLFFFPCLHFCFLFYIFLKRQPMMCRGKTQILRKSAGPVATGMQCMHSGPVKTLEVHNVDRSRKV